MYRTSTSFSLLQATAAVAALTVLLWSIGAPMFRYAHAANVTAFSNTLSDSAPGVGANHTISFVTPTGVAAGEQIVITFDAAFGSITSLNEDDLDLVVNSSPVDLASTESGTTWGVLASGSNIELTSASGTIPANATVTIRIGTNAVQQATGANQIVNPNTPGSYEITVAVGSSDTGATRIAIVDTVTVTATVETIFNFTVAGVLTDVNVNGATTSIATTPTSVPFGTLAVGNPVTGGQSLQVSTNAANGFVVTVQTDQQLTAGNGAVIDGFADASFVTTPTVWQSPAEDVFDSTTWGHWGLTTNDPTVTPSLNDIFDVNGSGDRYVSASTTPVEVFRHSGPTAGSGQGIGETLVGYRVEITALQEAAEDYTATLTYVATPVF